jgi:hypothetical protein
VDGNEEVMKEWNEIHFVPKKKKTVFEVRLLVSQARRRSS